MKNRIDRLKKSLKEFESYSGSNDFDYDHETNIEMIKNMSDETFENLITSIIELTSFYMGDL